MIQHTIKWGLSVVTAICAYATPALAVPIFSENFQGVILGAGANATKTVQAATPAEMSANTRSFSGDASELSFNVRKSSNAINGAGTVAIFGDDTFDAFFGSQFLVLGDNGGDIGNEPNGQPSGSSTVLTFDIPNVAGPFYNVSFSYAFDANNVANLDDFITQLVFTDNTTATVLNLLNPSATTRGTIDVQIASGGKVIDGLRFSLSELNGGGSSAVGIDNITLSVPEPSGLALLGAALLGLALTTRRGRAKHG